MVQHNILIIGIYHAYLYYGYFYVTDGHHKLIRWNLVTHAGIDGYSRLIVFMHCSNNNKASTVYNQFLEASRLYGLPSRVRTDQGRENTLIARHMNRGEGRGSIITGSSVHNQRIERLWRDMFQSVIVTFYRLFYHMEHHGLLNPHSDLHLLALHYVFLPRINRSLNSFKSSWNHHPIRTEHNNTPTQLFTSGALRLRNMGMVALDFFDVIGDRYGMDDSTMVIDNSDDDEVVIPENSIQLTRRQLDYLQARVDPLTNSDNYGIELYESTIDILQQILS